MTGTGADSGDDRGWGADSGNDRNWGRIRRVGDTVERPSGPWTPAVHRLLDHLAEAGIDHLPRPLGFSECRQRETVTFVEGAVPSYPMPAWVWAEEALTSAARLLRRLHDATADADRSGPWRSAPREPAEVICHHDFAPYNLVFRDGVAVGAIDWDFAAPGPRLWDLAYLAYRMVPLTTENVGDTFDGKARHVRLRHVLDAYGSHATTASALAVVVERLDALAQFSDRMAAETGRAELAEHAALYRRDAAALRRDRSA